MLVYECAFCGWQAEWDDSCPGATFFPRFDGSVECFACHNGYRPVIQRVVRMAKTKKANEYRCADFDGVGGFHVMGIGARNLEYYTTAK